MDGDIHMKLYGSKGYANIPGIFSECPASFIVMVGARGTGKTYGVLKEMLDTDERFILMRRTQTQLDMVSRPEFSPFKKLNADLGVNILTKSVAKGMGGFYQSEQNDKGDFVPVGAPIGYCVALSTVSNIRGFDASNINYIIYDEFIPEKHERPMKNEGQAFLNAYETINRNRELEGQKPVRAVLLSNANDLSSPILETLGLTDRLDRMNRKGAQYWCSPDNTIAVVFFRNSPISERKRETVLYKLACDNEFSDMALDNKFSAANYEHIANRPLQEYVCVVGVNNVYIYAHKSKRDYYVCRKRSGNPPIYQNLPTEMQQFRNRYGMLYLEYLDGCVKFSDFYSKAKFLALYD